MTCVHRHFLGWEQPFHPRAVQWLQEHYPVEELGWAKKVLILVPGQSVGLRLQALLVEQATCSKRAIEVPWIGTTSQWFDRLMESHYQVADQTTTMVTTAAVLRSLPAAKIEPIVGSRIPEESDSSAWFELARQVCSTLEALAFGGLTPQVTTWDEAAKQLLTDAAAARFDLLHVIQTEVQHCLQRDGLDLANVRRVGLIETESAIELENIQHVVLVGTSDLTGIATKLLARLSSQGISVDALIRAPEENAEAFDVYGCVEEDYWLQIPIDIPNEGIKVAGSPSGQAVAVLRELEIWSETCSADQITVASTDETSIPIIRRHLSGYGIQSRFAGGKPVLQTPAAIVLKALSNLVKTSSFASYAAFVRHPDVYAFVQAHETTLRALDRYSMDVVPLTIHPKKWFVPKDARMNMDELEGLHVKVFDLVGECMELEHKGKQISECSKVIREFLLRLYGEETLDRADKKLLSLQRIFGVIDRLDACSKNLNELFGSIRISEVLDLLLRELELVSIPEYPDSKAIEIVGWLDSMVVDTPHIVVVGMSADLVGGSTPSNVFLPDTLRGALGLETIDRRLARDAHAMTAMQQSRVTEGQLVWIVARKNADGDPLTPSPLLLRCKDATTLASRVTQLVVSFDREAPEVPSQFSQASKGVGLPVPKPSDYEDKPLTKLSVTAFKDYIACPYRFWLKHVLGLKVVKDGDTELDPKLFGSLVHSVLERFGKNESICTSTDAKEVEAYLSECVDTIIQKQFGSNISGTIGIQAELALHRLKQFAEHQVQLTMDGWNILCTEMKVRKELIVHGKPFTISGVIDRIDVHTNGRIRVLDYKTGSLDANAAHFKKRDGEWIDLQLPLYRKLLSEISELDGMDLSDANVELGYFKIGDTETSVGVNLLSLSDEAMAASDDVIEAIISSIQHCEYGDTPTEPAPKYSDDYSWICQDSNIIEEVSGASYV